MAENNMLDQNSADKKEKTVKYRVKNTCYWNEMLYRSGDVVELPETAKPPVGEKGHFEKLN